MSQECVKDIIRTIEKIVHSRMIDEGRVSENRHNKPRPHSGQLRDAPAPTRAQEPRHPTTPERMARGRARSRPPPLPPHKRVNKNRRTPPKTTRLQKLARSTYHPALGEKVHPFESAPWRRTVSDFGGQVRINANEAKVEKAEAAKAHEEKPEHLAMYSDGSLLEDKESSKRCVGYGVAGYHNGNERITRVGPMGSKSEVYDAEMAGLAWAACDALTYLCAGILAT
ncbi:hypothetical protein B0H10DRAFT_2314648 [Mycena sp. CBHHK59/15]|nr:hypothetical protein B0H10DRAFT_2314648 [Mycena sp. CBHHK59/15]